MRLHFTRRIAGAEGCTRSRLGPVRIPDVHVLRSALQIHEERKRAGSTKAKIVPNLNASHTTFMSYSNLLKISYLRLVSKYQRGTANLLSSDRGQSFAQVGESTDTWAAAGLQLAAAFDSLKHGDFVGVLDVAADGNAHGNAGHLQTGALELSRQIDCGCFAFDCRVGSNDDLIDLPELDPAKRLITPTTTTNQNARGRPRRLTGA